MTNDNTQEILADQFDNAVLRRYTVDAQQDDLAASDEDLASSRDAPDQSFADFSDPDSVMTGAAVRERLLQIVDERASQAEEEPEPSAPAEPRPIPVLYRIWHQARQRDIGRSASATQPQPKPKPPMRQSASRKKI